MGGGSLGWGHLKAVGRGVITWQTPPHNLNEVVTAAIYLVRNPNCTVDDLMGFIPGPDFPTAGLIYGRAGILSAYRTGRGSIVMRARIEVEKIIGRGDREQLVVRAMPPAHPV